jgi:hypothetical protein
MQEVKEWEIRLDISLWNNEFFFGRLNENRSDIEWIAGEMGEWLLFCELLSVDDSVEVDLSDFWECSFWTGDERNRQK